MHSLAVLCTGLLASVALAAPVQKKRVLSTIIPNYADVDQVDPKLATIKHDYAVVDKREVKNKLNTIIPFYSDAEGTVERRQLKTIIDHYADIEPATTNEKRISKTSPGPPTGSLGTIIHSYADLESKFE